MLRPLHPLLRPADFERVLKSPSKAKSLHFAVHHVSGGPLPSTRGKKLSSEVKLPTDDAPSEGESVDNSVLTSVDGQWLGMVVPKRHARRSVTRVLVKRQMREALRRHGQRLPAGLWVLRLKAGIDRQHFPSAASDALRQAVHAELDALLTRAASR